MFKPVVVNQKTRDMYLYNGENSFTNIRTNVTGTVSDEAARKTFKINPELSVLLNEFPIITKLVSKLGLIYEQKKDTYRNLEGTITFKK